MMDFNTFFRCYKSNTQEQLQDDIDFFSNYFTNFAPLHFTNVCDLLSCYHNGIIAEF